MDIKQKNVELLAPAGNWESLETVIKAGADAVYLGGRKHNMRMLREGYNFSNEQLKEAIKLAHKNNVKIYITVNNLQSDQELIEVEPYLKFLADIKPDALIIQDLGIAQLIKKLKIELPLHSSVMMNVHNRDMIDFLQDEGIKRFIISREFSFAQARDLYRETGAELEYFIHGDMCFSQSAQCLLSGMILGNSSNRGRCLKPCRWQYQLAKLENDKPVKIDTRVDGHYFMAVKDMCIFRFIPELIQSGIISFKVEGRMKTPQQLFPIISSYRQAIDAYLEDPAGYQTDEAVYQKLYENRVRNFSTCFALKKPGSAGIGYTGEREPKFFSEAAVENELELDKVLNDKGIQVTEKDLASMETAAELAENIDEQTCSVTPRLSIKVINMDQFKAALEAGADRIYFGGEVPAAFKPVGEKLINEAARRAADSQTELILSTPRITVPDEINEYKSLLSSLENNDIKGVIAGNTGMIEAVNKLTNFPIFADFGVNAFNSKALELLKNHGVVQTTIQLESSLKQAVDLVQRTDMPLEIIGHGYLPFMVSDHCLICDLLEESSPEECNSSRCRDNWYALINNQGAVYRVITDQYCRNHIHLGKEVALLPYLKQINNSGFTSFRIEAQLYEPEKIKRLVSIYKRALTCLEERNCTDKLDNLWQELKEISDNGYTLAGYEKGVLTSGD